MMTVQVPQKRTTIVDVARAAGVSVGTVSNVVSGTQFVRPETRARVQRAVDQLSFRPSHSARSLVRSRTDTIGIVIPNVANPFFAELVRGAEDVLGAGEYAVLLGNSDDDPDKERRYLDRFADRRTDGLIVVTASGRNAVAVHSLSNHIPIVIADQSVDGWVGDVVRGDSRRGMALVVEELWNEGHRRFAFVGGDPALSTAVERRWGFADALARHGLEPVLTSEGPFTIESGFEQGKRALTSLLRPTAICAANDLLALGVLDAAASLGIHVPDAVSVTGYDDIVDARLARPTLTTIQQPAREMGDAAARLLLDRLAAPTSAPRSVVIAPRLASRNSTGPLRQSSASA